MAVVGGAVTIVGVDPGGNRKNPVCIPLKMIPWCGSFGAIIGNC